jgi:hypothetical protein
MSIRDLLAFGAISALAVGLVGLVELRRDRLETAPAQDITGSAGPMAKAPAGTIPWVAPLLLEDDSLGGAPQPLPTPLYNRSTRLPII